MTGPTIPPSGGKDILGQRAMYPIPEPIWIESFNETVNIGGTDSIHVTNKDICCEIQTKDGKRNMSYKLKINPRYSTSHKLELTVFDSLCARDTKRKAVTVNYTYNLDKIQEQLEKFLSCLEKAHQNAKKTETKKLLDEIINRIQKEETTVRYHKEIFADQIKEE